MSYEKVKMEHEGGKDIRNASQKQLANLLRDLLGSDDAQIDHAHGLEAAQDPKPDHNRPSDVSE